LFVWGLLVALLTVASGWTDQRTERFIAPGAKHIGLYREAGPFAIHVLEIDRGQPYLRPEAALAGEHVIGLEPVSRVATRLSTAEKYAVGAVNGDFFIIQPGPFQGDPIGLGIANGELFSSPYPRSALVLTADGTPHIAVFEADAWVQALDGTKFPLAGLNQARGPNELVLYTPTFEAATRTFAPGRQVVVGGLELPIRPNRAYTGQIRAIVGGEADLVIPEDGAILSGGGEAATFLERLEVGENLSFRFGLKPDVGEIVQAVGGGPRLVRDGRVSIEAEAEGIGAAFVTTRHPRTAVGFNEQKFFWVTVDGRQPGYSVGMTLPELAALMVELGCQQALNLDGGGSTTFWVRGKVLNQPSDRRERPVANALLLFSTAPHGPPARLTLEPGEVFMLPGAEVSFTLTAEDEFYNPVDIKPGGLGWTVAPNLGEVTPEGTFRAATVGEGVLKVTFGEAVAEAQLHVLAEAARLEVTPTLVQVGPGGAQPLKIQAWDAANRPLVVGPTSVTWDIDPGLGQVNADGVFTATGPATRGAITARSGRTTAVVAVVVGSKTQLIDGFEGERRWFFTSYPAKEVPGSLKLVKQPRHEGEHAAQLAYDFTATDATRAAYANFNQPVGRPFSVSVWVYGDGNGNWLRGRFLDAHGETVTVDFAAHVDWKGEWRRVQAAIPPGTAYPITWKDIYLVQSHAEVKNRGVIGLDQFEGEYAPE